MGRTALQGLGKAVERYPWPLLGLLLTIYVTAELGYSLASPLWHDELFTYFLAQSPSYSAMWDRVRAVDLNPPLSYLLTRVSFALFGVGTLQCRLPEIVGFAGALVSVFLFVRERGGSACGLLAATLLFGSRAGELVVQARPYGLLLGTGALAMLAWQHAGKSGNALWRPANLGLFFAVVAMLCTHVFALLPWMALFVAECFRSLQQREVAWGRGLALLLPLGGSFLLWAPLLRNHARSTFPAAFQPSGADIFTFYMGHIDRELTAILLSALVVLLLAGRTWLRGAETFALWPWEWTLVGGLLAGPLLLMTALMRTHGAFFDRYGVTACLGTALLFALLFRWWSSGRPGACAAATLVVLLVTQRLPDAIGALVDGKILHSTEPRVVPMPLSLVPDATLPVVAASGLTFLEMQAREPRQLLERTFYLTDPAGARGGQHATIFEGMGVEARLFGVTGRVEPYEQFTAEHSTFYVLGTYDYPEDWLVRRLQADGAELLVEGRVNGTYKDHEVYKVSLRNMHSNSESTSR